MNLKQTLISYRQQEFIKRVHREKRRNPIFTYQTLIVINFNKTLTFGACEI